MIARFSLYSGLKNQKFFEPFFLLALVERGLSFTQIGALIAMREAMVIVMEIPSGAIADVTGRRRVMLLAVLAYGLAFAALGFGTSMPWFIGGMLLFGFGDSFRTGTHKAMIYRWLALNDKADERTRTYSITRSWGKVGSAVSVVIAAGIVAYTGSYASTFAWTIVPYVLLFGLLASYPRSLDGEVREHRNVRAVVVHMRESVGMVVRAGGARRLVVESALFEGVVRASRDYLQPMLALTAAAGFVQGVGSGVGLAVGLPGADGRVSAAIGGAYVVLFLLAAVATRLSSPMAGWLGEDRASRVLWIALAMTGVAVLAGDLLRMVVIGAVGLLVLHVVYEAWRPIMLGRLDEHVPESMGAAVLSVESQARRVATMVLAPGLGWAIDSLSGERLRLWPIAVAIGVACVLAAMIRAGSTTAESRESRSEMTSE